LKLDFFDPAFKTRRAACCELNYLIGKKMKKQQDPSFCAYQIIADEKHLLLYPIPLIKWEVASCLKERPLSGIDFSRIFQEFLLMGQSPFR
jgi:hypothetical protein